MDVFFEVASLSVTACAQLTVFTGHVDRVKAARMLSAVPASQLAPALKQAHATNRLPWPEDLKLLNFRSQQSVTSNPIKKSRYKAPRGKRIV